MFTFCFTFADVKEDPEGRLRRNSTVGTGDVAASPSKFFRANLDKIWANLDKIWASLNKVWQIQIKLLVNWGKFRHILVKFGQNQNLASPKTFNLLRL